MLKEFVTKYIKIGTAPKFCGKRESGFVVTLWPITSTIYNRFCTPLISSSMASNMGRYDYHMNMSCLKQNNAADAVVLQSSKELPPKAAQIPRLTKESRLVGWAAAFPFFLNFALALPLPIYPAHEWQNCHDWFEEHLHFCHLSSVIFAASRS